MALNFLPFLFLVITIAAIIAANRVHTQVGVSWLVLAIGTLLSSAAILIIRWVETPMIMVENWLNIGGNAIALRFGFDSLSWTFAFALMLILIGIVFTMPVRLDVAYRPEDWVFDLLFVLIGLVPIMAQNLLSLVIAWTLLDFLELIVHISGLTPDRINRQAVMAFAIRMGGNWLLILAQLLTQGGFGAEVGFEDYESASALLLLLAAGLRLGIFPVFMPFQQEAPLRRELGTIMRFVVPASSLILLTRLSDLVIPPSWAVVLSILALIASLFGVVMFFLSESSLLGRNYWVIALSSMAVVSVVRGQADAALIWSLSLLISGTYLSIHSEKNGPHIVFLIAMFLSLSGMPFTPSAAGVSGLIVLPFNLLDLLYILVFAILLAGFLRQQIKVEGENSDNAGWMWASYWLGLAVVILGYWFLTFPTIQQGISSAVWWGSIPSLVIALVGFYLLYRYIPVDTVTLSEDSPISKQFHGKSLVYPFIERIYFTARALIQFITNLLEGDSAILWILLLFLMVMTMILQGGG
ncbi:MAG: hypothetical protein V2J07_03220 [Anaerolineae bacterium]|jgi:hypothetical protein|nr:hypothetical protein [Anaerolineae bacterium]